MSAVRNARRSCVLAVVVLVGMASAKGQDPPANEGQVVPAPPAAEATTSPLAPPAPTPPPTAPGAFVDRFQQTIPLPLPIGRPGSNADGVSPGLPSGGNRPTPGSPFNPGASGPGIGSANRERFLGGALDPATGWPFVLLDHFKPRPERVERLWVVQTRDCPQFMGSDPWRGLRVLRFDENGVLQERSPSELFAQTVGRPVLIQVQGSLTTRDIALGGLLWTHSWLEYNRALPPEAVVIAFDWPSERIYRLDFRDIEEKGRRAYVAGYHLARFLQAFPPESRVCLLGQSYGGRVVPAALHLLGGGGLNSQDHDQPVRLPGARCDLQLRAIILAGASDHHWLDPDERFDRALPACQKLLNLYNRRDEALILYPLLRRSGRHRALGRVGLKQSDLNQLGPLAARYAEYDLHDELGAEHTLLDAVANPRIARRMAPYVWAPDPGPQPALRDPIDGRSPIFSFDRLLRSRTRESRY